MNEIQHDTQACRFQVEIEGHTAVLEYHMDGDTIVFTHTGVPEAIGGRGIGSQLVRAGLAYARRQGYAVRPLCWFVAQYVQRHPEYQNLLE